MTHEVAARARRALAARAPGRGAGAHAGADARRDPARRLRHERRAARRRHPRRRSASRARCRAPPRCRWPSATSGRAARGAPSCGAWPWSTSSSWRSSPAGAPRAPAATTCSAQLLAAGLDDAELRDHLVTLLAAGHETTAGSLAWALERLARAPDVFARVRAGDEAWIDAVVKETLRIRPVLTVAPRKLAAPLRVDGLELPAGVHVAPCIYLVHRREDLYPDARTWRPERWLGRRARRSPSRGSRSAAACAAAWARPSRRWRWPRSCASSPSGSTSLPRTRAASACAGAGITLQPGRGARVVLSDACFGFFVLTVLVVGSAWRWPALSMATQR